MNKSIMVKDIGKRYKIYNNHNDRLKEWIMPFASEHHIDKWVLQGINFSVNQGESLGIMGLNGAGKSTLLKIITGTTAPTRGTVTVSGIVSALLELGLGFHPDFTGKQNVYMSGQLLGYSTEEIKKCMKQVENFADIGEAVNEPVRTYSSGMQVRLAFAVATMKRPDILIVDEALAVGDLSFQAKCFARIRQFQKEGTTLLFVSHSAADMIKYCKRAIYLKNGRIVMDGNTRDVANRYLDDLFGKKKSINSLENDVDIKKIEHDSVKKDVVVWSKNDVYNTRPYYRKEEYRWGVGGAKIIDYAIKAKEQVFPKIIENKQKLELSFQVLFEREVLLPVYGMLIKTNDGIYVYGTNSQISCNNSKANVTVNVGDVVSVVFSFNNCLNRGGYLISFGITDMSMGEPGEPLDRRYDSVLLPVINTNSSSGMMDLNADCTIEKKEEETYGSL